MQLSLDNVYISARLQKKLDRIPMYPLTTVVAPAGYGKTTAVRWFREGLSKACMVLRLNVLGGGLNEFWRDFAELIGREAGASFSENGAATGHYDTARIPAQDTRACARKGNLPLCR